MNPFKKFRPYKTPVAPGVILPEIKIPKRKYLDVDLSGDESNFDFLRALCLKGYKDKGIDKLPNKKEYIKRIKYELEVFRDLEFVDYVLLNWDIIGFCHDNDIPVGLGRGSACGSLVLYFIGVTDVDPIRYGLFFERFVSKSRSKKTVVDGTTYLDGGLLPDVDNDISYDKRQDVIDYINAKYEGSTAKILTFNTLSGKLCMKECVKIVGDMNETEANYVSNMIPKRFGKVLALEDAREESKKFNEFCEKHPDIYNIARKLEGLNKNTGVHPSGIAIAHGAINGLIPLQKTGDGEIVTSFDMHDVASLAVKFDILGVRTLTVVDMTCKKLGLRYNEIDVEDEFIYQNLQDLENPFGLFQIEAGTNCQVARKCKPRNLLELSDVIALARPGALDYVDDYVRNKSDINLPESGNKTMDKILATTHGVILFQEQIMQIAHQVFGLSLDEAEILRRVIGKKKVKEIPKWKERIYGQSDKLKLGQRVADYYWDVLEASANYSFNKSHSLAYASLSAITVFLKFRYTKEFFLSILEMAKNTPDPHAEIESASIEMNKLGIRLLPPDLAKSRMSFSVEGDDIRYGLDAIKGVAEKTKEAIIRFRGSKFLSKYDMFEIAKECKINIGVLSSLVFAGTLSSFGEDRGYLALEAQSYNLLTAREKRLFGMVGEEYNYDLLQSIHDVVSKQRVGDDGKPIMKKSRFETFKKKYNQYKEIYTKNKSHPKFANWFYERTLLGYSYSVKLSDAFEDGGIKSIPISKVEAAKNNTNVKFLGVVYDVVTGKSRAGNNYMRLSLIDETGKIDVMMCDNKYSKKFTDYKKSGLTIPEKDSIIYTSGSKSDDIVFINEMNVVSEMIYTKFSQLNGK